MNMRLRSYLPNWIVLVTATLGCAGGRGVTPPTARGATLVCNLHGLSSVEREESQHLLHELGGAVATVQELPDGYALSLDTAKFPPKNLFRWVELERRCCPFFRFGIEVGPDSASASLRLSGSPEVKEFIRSQMARRDKWVEVSE
jgi:hypothetical protein